MITSPDSRSGRGKKLQSSPIKQAAVEMGLDVYQPADVNSAESLKWIKACKPDVFILFAYGQILCAELLVIPRWAINVHPSLLPKYRGAAPLQRAIMAGEEETGITIIQMSERVDAGGILLSQTIPIEPDDTYDSLAEHVARAAGYLVEKALEGLLDGTLKPTPQSAENVTKAPKIRKRERLIDWSRPAREIYNLIRAFPSRYQAYTYFRGIRLNVIKAELADDDGAGVPGTLVLESGKLLVQCGSGFIEFIEVKPEGKKAMNASAFVNGYRSQSNEVLSPE